MDISKVLPKAYEPGSYERDVYAAWESSGFFNPDALGKRFPDGNRRSNRPYCIVMPPPNTTGRLHLGHASSNAYEDILIRYKRMQGYAALYLPGTDHAAIATQNKVEKILATEGLTRQKLGREKFLDRVRTYVQGSQGDIKEQIRRAGASCDWSREAYTFDEVSSRVVNEVFARMYRDRLIYRGDRIVNWCVRCASTLADDEVEYVTKKTPFYYLKYGPVTIATARPETKFLDKVIVVHPDDKRYKKLIGKAFDVPWIEGTVRANVIADPIIDPALGTGAMTITPAHSFEDFELAKKHGIEIVQIIDTNGKLTSAAGSMAGMTVAEAREAVVKRLTEKKLIEKIDTDYEHNLSVCYRCGTPIEPLVSKQWFVAVNKKIPGKGASLKELALKFVAGEEIGIIPERFTKVYFHWMENLHDWCISRQIWWGHRIPVWYRKGQELNVGSEKLWDMKIYGKDIFDGIANGTKKIEVRAGRERGEGKYWGDFKPGDSIEFRLADEKTDAPFSGVAPVRKQVRKVMRFDSLEQLLKVYPAEYDYPGHTKQDLRKWWQSKPAMWERIQKYGVWAIELSDIQRTDKKDDLYVGTTPPEDGEWEQDPDTLDTWFSSATWTFSTLLDRDFKKYKDFRQWLSRSPDLKKFHPTAVLETGYDILFFWIARMILVTSYVVGEKPFSHVYLHGMIRDKEGRKMSKSLDNGIDPIDMIQKYGADALRLSLIVGSAPGQDIRVYDEKIAGYRNFVNKLWNIGRFIFTTVEKIETIPGRPRAETVPEQWILARLDETVGAVSLQLDTWQFSLAGETLYQFTRQDFADWYIEIAKIERQSSPESKRRTDRILLYLVDQVLRLWHPFAPYITEVLWRSFNEDAMLMIQQWPEASRRKPHAVLTELFGELQGIVTTIRNIRAENKVLADRILPVQITWAPLQAFIPVIERLGRCHLAETIANGRKITAVGFTIVADVTMPMSDKKRKELAAYVSQLEKKLSDEKFVKNAPPRVVAAEQKKLADAKAKLT